MALAREVLRLAAVRALRSDPRVIRWIADADRVRDSEQGPVEDYVSDKALPEILVYTDDGKFSDGASDSLFAGGEQNLTIEIVMTQKMRVSVEGPFDEWAFAPPETDASMELTIGMIERTIILALSDPNNEWAELFRSFALGIDVGISNRGSSMRDGVRFAGRQLVFSIKLPSDPAPDQQIKPLWARFLALAELDADLAQLVPMFQAMITGEDSDLADWQTLAGAYALTEPVARALKIAPPAEVDPDEPTFAEPVAAVIVESEP